MNKKAPKLYLYLLTASLIFSGLKNSSSAVDNSHVKTKASHKKSSNSTLGKSQTSNIESSRFVFQAKKKSSNFFESKEFLATSALAVLGLISGAYYFLKPNSQPNQVPPLDFTEETLPHLSDDFPHTNTSPPISPPRIESKMDFPRYVFRTISYEDIPEGAISGERYDGIKTEEGNLLGWAKKINPTLADNFPRNDNWVPIITLEDMGDRKSGWAIGCHRLSSFLIFERPDEQYFKPAILPEFSLLVEVFEGERWAMDNYGLSFKAVEGNLNSEIIYNSRIDIETEFLPSCNEMLGSAPLPVIDGISDNNLQILRNRFDIYKSEHKLYENEDILSSEPGGEFKTKEGTNFGWSLKLLPNFAELYPNENGYVHIVKKSLEGDFKFRDKYKGTFNCDDYVLHDIFVLNFLPRPEKKYFSFFINSSSNKRGNDDRVLRKGEIVCVFDVERWSQENFGKNISGVIHGLRSAVLGNRYLYNLERIKNADLTSYQEAVSEYQAQCRQQLLVND